MATTVSCNRGEASGPERETAVLLDRPSGHVPGTTHRASLEAGSLLPPGTVRGEREGVEAEEEEEEEADAMVNGGGVSKRKRFSPHEKTQILGYLRESNNLRATARKFGVDRKTIRSWVDHREGLGPTPETVVPAQGENPASSQMMAPVDSTPPTKRRRNLTAGEPLMRIGGGVNETMDNHLTVPPLPSTPFGYS